MPEAIRRDFPTALECGPAWAIKAPFSGDLSATFKAFYADGDGVRDAYLALWARIARRLAGHSGVIGYDLLNEPWGDERGELAPLYEDAARAIRAEDPSAILFVEPQVFLTTFGVSKLGLPRPSFGNFAYAPHFYDPAAMMTGKWALWRSAIVRNGFARMRAKARELGAPLFVGEFGVEGGMRNGRWYSDYQYDELDAGFLSGAQWDYTPGWTPEHLDGWNREDFSIVDGQGRLRGNFAPRPYARALAGEPIVQRELPTATARCKATR